MQFKKIVATALTAGVVMVGGTSAAFAATTPAAPATHVEIGQKALARKALRHRALKAGVKIAARTIGIDAKALVTEVRSGKTVAEVAEANNVDPSKVIDAVVTAGDKVIDRWVDNGRLSTERATALKARLAVRVAELVNNTPHPAG